MNQAHREVIEVISKELDWCNKNPMPQFSDEYRNGFRNGLIQARFLVSQMGRGLTPVPADGGYCTCLHNVGWIQHSTHEECTFCHRPRR